MRTVNTHLLEEKMDEAVTHYINTHHSNEPVHIDSNGIPMTVQDDGGGRVTIMHQQTYTTQMCRQVSVTEQVGEGPWGEELLEVPIAAIVAHLQNSRHHPPLHQKVSQVRSDVDTSVILDGAMRFNGQSMEQQSESLVVQLPPMQTLPPLQDMKRCTDSDWFTDNNKKDDECMVGGVELSSLSPAHHKQQSRKSLPHKKRISRKLKRNNGNCTPQQEQLVVINCSEAVPGPPEQEQILPDNYVTVPHATHIPHEVRPVLICQECGEYYGEEQLKFYHHLKSHYEPQHTTIIIENPVPDMPIDKMSSNCIVDNVATLPDSIVELSLENTVPKTLYQPIDKHILYSSSDKTLSYNTNKIQYSMASMDGQTASTSTGSSEGDKSDLYSSLDKLELFNCGKCSKTFRKQRHCEAHMREAHSNNTKIEDMGEFSEPEDLMCGISVCVTDGDGEPYEPSILPHLTVENGQVHQEHTRHWYGRGPGPAGAPTNGPCDGYCGACAREPDTPYKLLKEEVLQRIFDNEVSDNASFADNMIPDHGGDDHDHDQDDHNQHDQNEHSHRHNDHSHGHSHEHNDHIHGHTEQSHEQNNLNHGHNDHSHAHNEHSREHNEHSRENSHGYSEHSHGQDEHSHRHNEHRHGHNENSDSHNEYIHRHSVNHGHNTLHIHIDSFRNTQNSQDHNENENEQDQIENDHGHHEQILEHDNVHDRNENGNELSQDHSETSQDQYQIPKQEQDIEIMKRKHFSCPKCERVFLHRNSLLYHLLSHEGKQHTCRDCGKGFYTQGALKIHIRQHSDDRPYKCETCGREFRQWSDLKYHNNSLHSDKKPFKCEYCGKQFARKYSLNLHVRIHTGEKNYKCDFCTKSFRCSSYKISHMRTHTGDRPYKCEECQKCFRSAFDLRRHSLVHDKIRNRYEEHKPKIKETKTKIEMIDTKEEKEEKFELSPKKMKQVALASTARPAVLTKKIQKTKKCSKKGAPNVTVQGKDGQFKLNDGSTNNVSVHDTRIDYCTVKHIYCESDKIPIIFKEEHNPRELAMLKPIGVVRTENAEEKVPYRAGNTDGKLQVFTQVEKGKDYNGSIVPNSQVLSDLRHVEREVARDVRSEVVGEGVMAESGFLERLTAMYNIPAV